MGWLHGFWHLLSTPEGQQTLVAWGGMPVLTLIVFAETGLLIGFFLPGDSILFIAGFLASPAGKGTLSMKALGLAEVKGPLGAFTIKDEIEVEVQVHLVAE